jgi:hypothetical protein
MAEQLPALCYIGDEIVGVVSDCQCPQTVYPLDAGPVCVASHPHESHDIVPPRMMDDLPEGVDFEHYKQWCRMFAAAPDLLAACKLFISRTTEFATDPRLLLNLMMEVRPAIEAAIAKTESPASE